MGIAAVLAFWIMWDCCFEPHALPMSKCSQAQEHYLSGKYLSVMLQPAFPVRGTRGAGR